MRGQAGFSDIYERYERRDRGWRSAREAQSRGSLVPFSQALGYCTDGFRGRLRPPSFEVIGSIETPIGHRRASMAEIDCPFLFVRIVFA